MHGFGLKKAQNLHLRFDFLYFLSVYTTTESAMQLRKLVATLALHTVSFFLKGPLT